MEYDNVAAREDFVSFCLEQYIDNESTIALIGEFERSYGPSFAFRYSTKHFVLKTSILFLRWASLFVIFIDKLKNCIRK